MTQLIPVKKHPLHPRSTGFNMNHLNMDISPPGMDSPTKRYPMAIVLPFLSFLSIAFCIAPLVLHSKNRNFPASCLISWFIILDLFNIINAFVWPTDDTASWWDGTGLCDVEVKIMVATYVGVPGCLVCIFRGLAIVMDTNRATWVPSKSQRWRNRLFDLLFCVVVPCIAMITHIVWQKSRYFIFSISGCVNNFDESWVGLVLAYMWPPIICLIAAYYCCLVLIRLNRYRSDFVHILRSRGSKMNKSGFLRLFSLAFTMLLAILPVQAYVVYRNIAASLPWHAYSWSKIHGPQWYRIIKVPTYGQVFFDRWSPIASGFMIFIFFGFGHDAMRMYRILFWSLGLGYCFPGVARPVDSQHTAPAPPANDSNSTTLISSTQSRIKLLFKPWKSSSRSNGTQTTQSSGYNDLEKGGSPPTQQDDSYGCKSAWFHSLFSRRGSSRSNDQDTLLDDLPGPAQTVSTNAWAGASRSRPSAELENSHSSTVGKDTIYVKQVIRQQSEPQD